MSRNYRVYALILSYTSFCVKKKETATGEIFTFLRKNEKFTICCLFVHQRFIIKASCIYGICIRANLVVLEEIIKMPNRS